MKQKMIYISDEMFLELKASENASKLIEDLLRAYFRKIDPKLLTEEERQKEIARLEISIEAKKKIEAIQ